MKSSSPFFLFLLLASAVSLAAWPGSPADDTTVAVVNGEPVSVDEYTLVMHRQTAPVFAYFKRTRDLDDRPGYWSPSSGPDGPLATLRERTLAELVRIKVVQTEARARGLLKNIDFVSFRDALEKENARRREAKARDEVIYGPPQYRPDVYYFILFGDIAYKVEQAMAKELEPAVTDAEIDALLAAHRSEFAPLAAEDARVRARVVLGLRAAQRKLETLRSSAVTELRAEPLARISPRAEDATS